MQLGSKSISYINDSFCVLLSGECLHKSWLRKEMSIRIVIRIICSTRVLRILNKVECGLGHCCSEKSKKVYLPLIRSWWDQLPWYLKWYPIYLDMINIAWCRFILSYSGNKVSFNISIFKAVVAASSGFLSLPLLLPCRPIHHCTHKSSLLVVLVIISIYSAFSKNFSPPT